MSEQLGMKVVFDRAFDATVAALPDALAQEGFGVLTQIDVRETLKQKLGVDFRPYKILGACNPGLAHRALNLSLDLGVMLPCNVIVYEEAPGRTVVTIVDPRQTVAARQGAPAQALVEEVRQRLNRVLEQLQKALRLGAA